MSSEDMKKKNFEIAMSKGNARSKMELVAEEKTAKANTNTISGASNIEESSDGNNNNNNNDNNNNIDAAHDPEVKASLEKAKRIVRLKELRKSKAANCSAKQPDAAEVIANSIASAGNVMTSEIDSSVTTNTSSSSSSIVFESGGTKEFIDGMRTSTTTKDKNSTTTTTTKSERKKSSSFDGEDDGQAKKRRKYSDVKEGDEDDTNVDMDIEGFEINEEMGVEEAFEAYKQQHEGTNNKDDDEEEEEEEEDISTSMLGMKSSSSRGMAGILSMLKSTGDLSSNNKVREEMHGRANDEKTYEDFNDSRDFVNLDERTATDKDKKMASKSVNLEYRDEQGRLLTRKEAFRQLCYQFHGFGSGRKKEEKRMGRLNDAKGGRKGKKTEGKDTMGQMKKTMAATGRAFVVHRT